MYLCRSFFVVLVFVVLALIAPDSCGQDPSSDHSADSKKGTPKHYLTFTVGYVGTAFDGKAGSEFGMKIVFADEFNGVIEVRPELEPGGVTWYPHGENVSIYGSVFETSTSRGVMTGEGNTQATETSVVTYTGYPVCQANLVNAFARIRPNEKLYDIQFTLMPDMASTMEAVLESKEHVVVGAPSLGGGQREKPAKPQAVPLDMGPGQMSLGFSNYYMVVDVKGEKLSGDTNELAGTKRILLPRPAGWIGSWDLALEVTWNIDVALPPVELIITADGYDAWRPETTPKREPGTPLEVTAKVLSLNGGPGVGVKSFIWELQGTSKEPGVALNFPLDQFTDNPDLELDASGEDFVLTQEKQRMVRTVRSGSSDHVKVVPFDWGGWSTLQVTALLEDGRRVKGRLKGSKELGLRIPKRDKNSHIADIWKTQNKIGADDLDDENEPVGDGNKGDGFTLYEEYRGFIIEGEHVEGDPKAKDFFVLNLIGADAEPGIALFESLSGFRVHTTTQVTEMSEEIRKMNGDFTEGAHGVEQHGVVLKTFESVAKLGGSGAFTVPLNETQDSKLSFRPGTTKAIGILPRGHAESDFSKPFNLRAEDVMTAFDRAIAHELMHSVGAIHHGTGDGKIDFVFVAPENALSTVGRPYFAVSGHEGKPVELRDESKHDLAAETYVRYATALSAFAKFMRAPLIGNPGDPGYPKMSEADFLHLCDADVNELFNRSGLVGAENGQHSGEQDCIMRYSFAKFYPMKKPSDGFYEIAAGAERVGSILCNSSEGTGVNDSGHYPQSRHGNAADEAGNCAAQISPNDAVKPRATPF